MASLIQRPDSSTYYIQYMVSGKAKRVSTETESLQIAKEKLRQFESAQSRGDTLPLPTRTPIASVVTAYVSHIRTVKTAKSAQTDTYYLRDVFGPICDALKVNSRKMSAKAKKRPPKPGQDRRRRTAIIEASCFEQITTADIAAFISSRMKSRGLAPKTANRYREILTRMFNWAMTQNGVRMPRDKNPAASVERYKEHAPEISFLTLEQIDEQLVALSDDVKMQAMVATLIFAGLRREELLWLTPEDLDWAAGGSGLIRIRAKTVGEESWQPKTKKNRGVPVSKRLRTYLDKWRLKNRSGRWLFPNSDGNRYDPDNFSRDLRAANAEHALDWSNLDYRHTFGSQLAMKGESLYKIATLMGNSPEICQRHYAALLPESLIEPPGYQIMGNDYYGRNEKILLPDGSTVVAEDVMDWYQITKEYYERYKKPVMHTETNFFKADVAPIWLWKQWINILRIRADGIPVLGFTWYSLTDQVDWDSGLEKKSGKVNECGLYDLNRKPRPVAAAYRMLLEHFGQITIVPHGEVFEVTKQPAMRLQCGKWKFETMAGARHSTLTKQCSLSPSSKNSASQPRAGSAFILDPFCGSGSTLIAHRDLGRRSTGIEIDPEVGGSNPSPLLLEEKRLSATQVPSLLRNPRS